MHNVQKRKKIAKRKLLLFPFILVSFQMLAQSLEAPVTQFKAGYRIQGMVVKKHFVEDQKLSITWNDGSCMDGTLKYDGITATVKGEYKNAVESIIGTFAVQNTKKGELSAKSKLPLVWNVAELIGYSLLQDEAQVELTSDGTISRINLIPFSNDFDISSVTAYLSHKMLDTYGFRSIDSLVLHSDYLRITYNDGQIFEGAASFDRGYLMPVPYSGKIRELPMRNIRDITFDRNEAAEYNVRIALQDDKLVEAVEFHIPSPSIPEQANQMTDVIFAQAGHTNGKVKLTHGRSFVGEFTLRPNITNLDVGLQNGTIDFGNGDRFTGNAGGKWIANVPVDGTVTFSDGSSKQGNWLSAYKLSELDYQVLSKHLTPSECFEEASVMNSHNKQTRTFSGRIEEGPFGYYYSGRPLEIEEGSGKYAYYPEDGDRVMHGAYNFKFYTYLSSAGKDLISVTGAHYNGIRSGDWQLVHKGSDGAAKADLKEHYVDGKLQGPFTYTFTFDGMKYTIKGNYVDDLIVGEVSIAFREGRSGFDVKGTFDYNGWADGKWSLIDRRDRQETVFIFNHGSLTGKSGQSRVSVQDIFIGPYEPMSQYRKIKNGFKK